MGDERLDGDPPAEVAELIECGIRCRLFAYRAPDGSCPALDELERMPSNVQQAYGLRFRKLCEHGPESLREDQYHKWTKRMHPDPAIKEFGAFKDIRSKTRIPSFPDGDGIRILTHMIQGKKEDKLSNKAALETLRIRDEYLKRRSRFLQAGPVPAQLWR